MELARFGSGSASRGRMLDTPISFSLCRSRQLLRCRSSNELTDCIRLLWWER